MVHLDSGILDRLLAGALEASASAAAKEHLAGCPECQRLVGAAVAARAGSGPGPDETVERTPSRGIDDTQTNRRSGDARTPASSRDLGSGPQRMVAGEVVDLEKAFWMGRYVVLNRVGAGGMGVVYAAYDPELDRRVALKLLRSDSSLAGSQGQARLLREAQAMARLSHPNVVAVHDLGTFSDQVFIAMELVEGRSGREWLTERPRKWREVVAMFAQAGRGLAAAHAAGLVHRDFKPDNVLVGKDGAVRVTDFGLAAAAASPPEAGPPGPEPRSSPSGSFERRLTEMGAVMGTPGYMAPEQYQAAPADARSDQFSFCVSVYEGIYRQRPFEGHTAVALAEAVAAGRARPPPRGTDVPARIWKALQRGLAANPAARWPSMEALLAALERDPWVARRRALAAASVLVVAAAAFAVVRQRAEEQAAVCRGGARKLAGLWDAPVKERVSARFREVDPAGGEATFGRVAKAVDSWTASWSAARVEACEATRVLREQPEPVMALRLACLDERLRDLQAASDLFSTADAPAVRKAVDVAYGLPRLEPCADGKALSAAVKPPEDPAVAAKVEQIRQGIARVRVDYQAGRFKTLLQRARALLASAKETKYRPVVADAADRCGELLENFGDYKEAQKAYEDAFQAALASRADHRAALIAGRLAREAAFLRHPDDAARWESTAFAILERGSAEPIAEIELLDDAGTVRFEAQKYAEAVTFFERALALEEKTGGLEETFFVQTAVNLGNGYAALSRFDEAMAVLDRALAAERRVFGPQHSIVAMTRDVVGGIYKDTGRLPEALEEYRAALAIQEAAVGPDNDWVANEANNIGVIFQDLNRDREAIPWFRRALATYEKVLGPGDVRLATPLVNLCESLARLGEVDEAIALGRRAVAIEEKVDGPEHANMVGALRSLAVPFERARRPGEARKLYERALAICRKTECDPIDIALTKEALGELLWNIGADRVRGRQLVEQAGDEYRALGRKRHVDEVTQWLAQHRR